MRKNILMIFALLCMVVQGATINLAGISSDLVLQDGDVVTGKLNKIVQISIADGATVTLNGVTINPAGNRNNKWSGIICLGDATIFLAAGTENIVRSFMNDCSGICVQAGKTLTIDGTGTLDAAPNTNESSDAGNCHGAAGIGGHDGYNSGNIIIKNGNIKARGNWWGTGIGCGYRATGGNILIEGGIVNARPGKDCGGIGSGYLGENGTVTITKDAVVTSYKDNNGIYSIGQSPSSWSKESKCGTVTIGCTLDGNGQPEGGHVGQVSASPFTYFCYTIVINDGCSGTTTQEVERGFDSKLTLPNNLSREGYTFLGWVAENVGNKKFYPDGTKYSDLDVEPKTTVTLSAQWIKGAGTAENPYEIASDGDWLTMAHYMSTDGYTNYYNKHYKLTADISVTETVAKGATPVSMFGIGDERSFRGTFDGDGHTITLNITDNREEHYCGPFRIINGATIKNLHVTGTIVKATWKHVGGMVGKALGTNNIINCRSSVDVQVNTDGDCSSGGFIGDLRGGTTTLTGCTFDGKLRGPGGTESRSTKWGGFIGWVADGRKAVLNTCVFAPAEIRINSTKDCRTFARRDDGDDVTLNDCYYFRTLGSAQGSQVYSVTSDEHVNIVVGEPKATYNASGINVFHKSDNELVIYKFITYDGVIYAAKDNLLIFNLSQNGVTPDGYTAGRFITNAGSLVYIDPYYLKMPNANITISLAPSDFATGHDGSEADPYLIYTVEQWAQLVSRVNGGGNSGYSGKHFRLMADITLTETYTSGSSTVMVGASSTDDNKKFRGTFDGNGHTITLNLNDTSGDNYCGLFRFIKDATIKKLHVAGSIVKSSGKYIGGLVGKAEGLNNTIRSCHCSVDILSNVNGDASSGGFVGDVRGERVDISEGFGRPAEYINPVTTFTDCLFDGKLRGAKAYKWGGFVGYAAQYNVLYFNNCLFDPAEVSIDSGDNDDNSRTLARMYESSDTNIHPSNSYYKLSIKETTQGALSVGSMTNDELADALGSGWNVFDDKVQPIMGLYSFDGNGTQASPYVIASAADWNGLSTNVATGETYNGKYFQLGANITVSRMVATTAEKCFQGYFDGAGNKLTFNCEGHKSNVAPFGYVNGATFENLHIAGTIHSSGYQIAGLICRAQGENYIRNCRNSIIFDAAKGSGYVDGESYGGYIMAVSGGTTVFTGCVFDGSFASTTSYGPTKSAGFVSLMGSANVQINDCLFAPAYALVDEKTFKNFAGNTLGLGTLELNNSYYINVGGGQGNEGIEINADYGITMEGFGIVTEYDVSGITGYLDVVKYGDYLYAPSGEEVRINLDYDRSGYTATGYNVLYDYGTITGTESPYTLTITNSNVSSVTIEATKVKNTLTLADAADNSTTIIDAAATGKQYDVTLADRTLFHDTKWNTLCLPFNVAKFDGTPLAGATVMELDTENFYTADGTIDNENGTLYTGFNVTSGTLHLYFKTVTSIEAGKPYIVKWTANDASAGVNPVFEGITLTDFSDSNGTTAAEKAASHLATTAAESMDGAIQFIGTYDPVTIGSSGDNTKLYLGNDNTLYWPNATMNINTHRAYFQLSDGLTAGDPADPNANNVRAFNLHFGDVSEGQTGILVLSKESGSQGVPDAWFDLSGRRLSGNPTGRGIYINNGRKVVIK